MLVFRPEDVAAKDMTPRTCTCCGVERPLYTRDGETIVCASCAVTLPAWPVHHEGGKCANCTEEQNCGGLNPAHYEKWDDRILPCTYPGCKGFGSAYFSREENGYGAVCTDHRRSLSRRQAHLNTLIADEVPEFAVYPHLLVRMGWCGVCCQPRALQFRSGRCFRCSKAGEFLECGLGHDGSIHPARYPGTLTVGGKTAFRLLPFEEDCALCRRPGTGPRVACFRNVDMGDVPMCGNCVVRVVRVCCRSDFWRAFFNFDPATIERSRTELVPHAEDWPIVRALAFKSKHNPPTKRFRLPVIPDDGGSDVCFQMFARMAVANVEEFTCSGKLAKGAELYAAVYEVIGVAPSVMNVVINQRGWHLYNRPDALRYFCEACNLADDVFFTDVPGGPLAAVVFGPEYFELEAGSADAHNPEHWLLAVQSRLPRQNPTPRPSKVVAPRRRRR